MTDWRSELLTAEYDVKKKCQILLLISKENIIDSIEGYVKHNW